MEPDDALQVGQEVGNLGLQFFRPVVGEHPHEFVGGGVEFGALASAWGALACSAGEGIDGAAGGGHGSGVLAFGGHGGLQVCEPAHDLALFAVLAAFPEDHPRG